MRVLGTDPEAFPDPCLALREPDGLLCVGGDLSVARLLAAYRRGIFPWFDDDRLPMWFSPSLRAVLELDELHISRSLRRRLARGDYEVRIDSDFAAVVAGCAAPRSGGGTWITPGMQRAYRELHRAGFAHSFETWVDGRLVGGLYGVSIGAAFFGESMFARMSDASKIAFVHLCRQLAAWDFELLDCQVLNPHMASLGAKEIPRAEFLARLERALTAPTRRGCWSRASGADALTANDGARRAETRT